MKHRTLVLVTLLGITHYLAPCSVFAQTNFWVKLADSINTVRTFVFKSTSEIFAFRADAGVYRSTNQGTDWSRPGQENFYTTEAATVTPVGDLIAVANPGGLYRSNDNGQHWEPQDLSFPIARFYLSSGDYMFAAGRLGFSRSTDRGQTWTHKYIRRHTYSYMYAGRRMRVVEDITPTAFIMNTNGDLVLSSGDRLWISRSSGKSWKLVTIVVNGRRALGSTDLAHDGRGNLIAANEYNGELFRSTNFGKTWVQLNYPAATYREIRGLAVNTNGDIFIATDAGGIIMSTDNGNSWGEINSGFTLSSVTFKAFTIGPNGYLYMAAESGIYRSADPINAIQPLTVPQTTTDEIETSYRLSQNYPNPFNPTTTIEFVLPVPAIVTLKVYNMLGQEVAELIHSELMDEGMQDVEFSATGGSASGGDASTLPSGVYFYRLVAQGIADEETSTPGNKFVSVKKMVLVK